MHQRAGNPGKGMAALLQALLPHTSQQLKWLKLQGVAAQLAMPIVAQLRGLRQLQLRSCQLTHLPSGPYLEGAIGCMPAGDWLHAGWRLAACRLPSTDVLHARGRGRCCLDMRIRLLHPGVA